MFKTLPPGPPKETVKIDDYTWEIPKTYKKGMNVPARVIATQKLLKSMDGQVFDQLTNVACLPGIQKYAYCAPDAHSGYGFPIGGIAAMDTSEGVISPGGIGFDINCLHPDTKILTKEGYYKTIKEFSKSFAQEQLISISLETKQKTSAKPYVFMAKHYTKVLEITTRSGKNLIVSKDHPLFTPNGMIPAQNLTIGNSLITHPFNGVSYEHVKPKPILTKRDIEKTIGNRYKLIRELEQKELLPLKYNSKHLPLLAKLVGFLTGDGWIGTYYSKKRKQEVWSIRVIGKLEDLQEIQKDLLGLGYESNYTSTKSYNSVITYLSGKKRAIKGISHQLYINSQSLAVLLHLLGVPEGNKSRTTTEIPLWIKNSPLWIKRLYLAGLFGAELTKPLQRKNEPKSFTEPSFSQNKIDALGRENLKFMIDLINLLNEFGIKTNNVYRQECIINTYGEHTHKLALRISAKPDNLIKLWSTIGFEYCKERRELSAVATTYLQYKQFQTIISDIDSPHRNLKLKQKIVTFQEFKEESWIPGTELVKDAIISIQEKPYNGPLYDFTMDDDNHNFIANSIVSSNCGMRLITTNLTHDEIKPHLKKLVDNLFTTVPTGVGCKGFVTINKNQFKNVSEEGIKWCIENGYGRKEDLKKTESHGRIEWADTSKVSEKAITRGFDQLGTLGSGNHYLEIQVAHQHQIFDKKIAKIFGITKPEQVVIMVHCGSRGYGHQIATDYLKVFDDAMKKYNITVPDRELGCAPFSSKEGQDYYKAMACAANMAFANRQVIMHRIREAFTKVLDMSEKDLGLDLVYDVAHNIAKVEKYKIDGSMKELVIHRKGSTRAFGPGQEELPESYREVGQPVIIGGSMETGSYLLLGTQKAMDTTFGSTAHGSGRTMSRTQAKKEVRGEQLLIDMESKGIYVKSKSMSGLAEEAGSAYKPISDVVEALDGSGISKKLVGLSPIGNIKG